MKALGNIILEGSLSLYIWGKNVGTKRAIPRTKQAEYRQLVKDYVCQEEGKTDKRKTLSILNSQKTECELHYNDVMNRRGLTDEERIKECKKRFGNIKKKSIYNLTTKKEKSSKESTKKKAPPKGNIPIWCSAALAAAEGIGRIISMPFSYALNIKPKDLDLKLPRKAEEENDDRLMIVGDVHNDPAYITKLKQRIRNALDDPRNGNEKIIVACENTLYDEETAKIFRRMLERTDEKLKEKHGDDRGIKFFYETLENHIGKEAVLDLNATLRCSGNPKLVEMTRILSKEKFGSSPQSYAKAILEAYKDIDVDHFSDKLDTENIEHNMRADTEASYLEAFLRKSFEPFGSCQDIVDITNYKRIFERRSLYEDFKDNDRVVFKEIDKKQEDLHAEFEQMMNSINNLISDSDQEELKEESFTKIDHMLKECFSSHIDNNRSENTEALLKIGISRKKNHKLLKERFNILFNAVKNKDTKNIKEIMNVLSDDTYEKHIKTQACSYVRSLGMLEEGRTLAKEYPNSEIIMFMGKSHSYDLQKDAPHANFNERYKIDNGTTVIDNEG